MVAKTVVILGGTAEARRLADRLVDHHGSALRVITSLAGRTKNPKLPKGEVRDGGFGGPDGLATYLKGSDCDLLIDATHPYAAQITRHAAAAADTANVPRLLLNRPAWEEHDNDNWTHVPNIDAAAKAITRKSKACLITTGVNDLAAFSGIVTTRLFVRLIETPDNLPLESAEIVMGTPPYRTGEEVALMQMLGIDLIVTKNAGGSGTYAKIEAARELGIEVIMIDRPAHPESETAADVDDAFARTSEILGYSAASG